MSQFFEQLSVPKDIPPPSESERKRLVALSTYVARCRSAVERDGYSREIELIPGPEAPGRLVNVLARLLSGLIVIGLGRQESWHLIAKVAMDSIPEPRRKALDVLAKTNQSLSTTLMSDAIRYPTQTTRRTLEDLTAYVVVRRIHAGSGKADKWRLSEWSRRKLAAIQSFPEMSDAAEAETVPERSGSESLATVPEMSGEQEGLPSLSNTNTIEEDISGKVPVSQPQPQIGAEADNPQDRMIAKDRPPSDWRDL